MKGPACWMTSPDVAFLEIASQYGFKQVVLDIEHGTFDLKDIHAVILAGHGLGFKVHAKVLDCTAAAIHQALDFGADSVIIPHIEGVEHAKKIVAAAKYPSKDFPDGRRSFAGTRQTNYGGVPSNYFDKENNQTKCYPMVETPEAYEDIEKILALSNVDGVFVGPYDLSLLQHKEAYTFKEYDAEAIKKIGQAASKSGKHWILPAWRTEERDLARAGNAEFFVTAAQYHVLHAGFSQVSKQLASET